MTPEATTRMTTIPANSSAKRKRARANTSGPRGSATAYPLPFRGAQDVPGAAQCLDAAGRAGLIKLATQAAHVHVHDVGESVVLLVPGVIEDAVAREHLPGVPHEQLEEAELLGAECDLLAVAQHAAPVSYTHLRAHETRHDLVCRLLLEKKKKKKKKQPNQLSYNK